MQLLSPYESRHRNPEKRKAAGRLIVAVNNKGEGPESSALPNGCPSRSIRI